MMGHIGKSTYVLWEFSEIHPTTDGALVYILALGSVN